MSIYFFCCIFLTIIDKEVGEHLHVRTLTEEEKAFILTLTPGHIWMFGFDSLTRLDFFHICIFGHIAFATGSSRVLAIGFLPSPKLIFVHDDTKHIPIANTCSNDLQIFVNRIWQMMSLITIFWWLL